MSFAKFHEYLLTDYVSVKTGGPLGRGSSSDYPSRLRTLERLLGRGIEDADPSDLGDLARTLSFTPSLNAVGAKARSDFGVALRAYQTFLNEAAGTSSGQISPLHPTPHRVYIANFGRANSLWPRCLRNNTLSTFDDPAVHEFWRAGDRDGYVSASITHTTTALGAVPSIRTAGRWFNIIEELRDTENDLWITRQGDLIWWTVSLSGDLTENLEKLPDLAGPEVWILEKPCRPWSNNDGAGRALRWSALHPKARDFLATEATFQTLGNDRGYADYARALIAGEELAPWHRTPQFSVKAAEAGKGSGRIFSPKELAASRMTQTLLATVAGANGQTVERKVKEKLNSLSRVEWEELLRQMMGDQEDRCALTGLPLGYDRECDDKELLVSLDRIDSKGHYTSDNVQLVCRFINRWKSADDDPLTRRLLGLLKNV